MIYSEICKNSTKGIIRPIPQNTSSKPDLKDGEDHALTLKISLLNPADPNEGYATIDDLVSEDWLIR